MKALLILLPCLLAVAFADPDYDNLSVGDFGTATCRSPPSGFVESPVTIIGMTCCSEPFSISMPDSTDATVPAFDTATGAFTQPYTAASLIYNGTTYTATQFSFRTQSEHIVSDGNVSGPNSAEIQIEMTGDGKTAIFSILVQAVDFTNPNNSAYKESTYSQVLNDFSSDSNWTVYFSTLSTIINDGLSNIGFLGIYVYNGTKTYGDCDAAVWFVYAREIYADQTVINALADKTEVALGLDAGPAPNFNNRPMNVTGGGEGIFVTSAICRLTGLVIKAVPILLALPLISLLL